ncbi:YwiC-like family protein [Ornithinibacter aureus]|uniref:YwiC-like family protein n=1 Tax=Ornithinibacter aureus TaxID=622664 RepID=A0ABP8JDD4_9MICO|nr:YwiC-like protein [Ornithinibacter aureus]
MPNQHGAWAMLATPLAVGILASGPAWVHMPLTAFWFLGYFAFFAAGLWLKAPPRRRPALVPPLHTYAVASAAFGALTLALDPGLLRWAPLFVAPTAIGLVASARRDERSLWSGLATSIGSSLMVLVAYDAGSGTDWERAWLLTGILAAYFAGTVLYVKTMIRERGDERFHWLSALAHGAATVAMTGVDPWLVLVFALLTIRAAALPAYRLSPKAVGIGEVVATVVVATTALLVT